MIGVLLIVAGAIASFGLFPRERYFLLLGQSDNWYLGWVIRFAANHRMQPNQKQKCPADATYFDSMHLY